jgi:hypothetical protein
MKNRTLKTHLQRRSTTKLGRITVLTGARQTGKTTLAQRAFPNHAYLSLEDPVTRPDFGALSAAQWRQRYPVAILDEVQKLPSLIESIKAVYDRYPETRYLLLGSSQILLLEKVRESLAGRAALVELYPLTLPERLTHAWDEEIRPSRLVQWLINGAEGPDLGGIPRFDDYYARAQAEFEDYLQYGAMPVMADADLSPREKYDWLHDYVRTYLLRDVRDLANLRELEPFVRAQKTLATLTGQLLNSSQLAQQAGISAKTAKRFVTYLEVSYQILQLPPWFRNLGKRLVKSPKIHFLDPGIQRVLLGRRGELTGSEFESAVVAEIFKQIENRRLGIECYHLRTLDGREVDLLLELETGFVAIEIKSAKRVSRADARHLHNLHSILDKPLLHSLLISNDPGVQTWDESITALPAAWLLSHSFPPTGAG